MTHNTTRAKELGFSLIEALVATAMLAMIASMAVTLFVGFFNGKSTQDNLTGLTDKAFRLRQILGDDLAHAVIRPHGPSGSNFLFSGDTDNNCFLSFARRNALKGQLNNRASDIESLIYCVNGRQLVRYAFEEPDALENTKRRNYVVISDIETMDIRFYDGQSWLPTWLLGVQNGRFFGRYGRLPSLIEITWTPANRDSKMQPIRQLFQLPPETF